ncbi:unnamed protein product [Cylindrotheca closterium]|uniref:guanylate cyclase n=1 Tax=Cylindrotheca closterium TaxID=2856 RepID=A0AAD2GCY9_9STRA|nr:unnamed protein product [Cylindrotheca closterium]
MKLQRVTICLLLILGTLIQSSTHAQQDLWAEGELNCAQEYREFDPLTQKQTYYVGVHATSGLELAHKQFNLTFESYLNEAVGKRWNPPIEFKMVVTETPLRDWIDLKQEIDFMYTDSGVYSCIGLEIGAQPLATTIARLKARGREYEVDVLSGAMITLADTKDIDSVEDLKGKIIGAHSFSDFASAQSQFYEMQKNGMDYITDPKQVVFTGNDEETIRGVLDGRWDVGFVRTGQVEKTLDPSTNKIVDVSLLNVLEQKNNIMTNGEVFPFLHSTPVFPEWPLAAKESVDALVAEEVANAMIAMKYHGSIGEKIQECIDEARTDQQAALCRSTPLVNFDTHTRCDTTQEMAALAYEAEIAGFHSGFRSPRSYFNVRTMQQEAGFVVEDEYNEKLHCARNAEFYGGIVCPAGHYKVSKAVFETQCEQAGAPCPEGHSCYCSPCIQAYEVNVYPYSGEQASEKTGTDLGCGKMSLCGIVEKDKELTYHVYDNLEREDSIVTAVAYLGAITRELPVTRIGPFLYKFQLSKSEPGLAILEVLIDGVHIPESPVQVQITSSACEVIYPGEYRIPNAQGDCICPPGTLLIAGRCVSDNAHAVGIYPWTIDGEDVAVNMTIQSGCNKMDICAEVPQTKEIRFRAHDNQLRHNASLEALIHIGQDEWYLPVSKIDSFVYEFGFIHNEKGVAILEIFVDGIQIPDSPVRVDVEYRDCDLDYPGQRMAPSEMGVCECSESTMLIGSECVPISTFAAIAATIGVLIACQIAYCFLAYRRRKNDEIWQVDPEELELSHPVEVIGQGAFGVVLAAEYRGTKVAIKRVIPLEDNAQIKRLNSRPSVSGGAVVSVAASNENSQDNGSDPELGQENGGTGSVDGGTGSVTNSKDTQSDSNLSVLFGGFPMAQKKTRMQRWFPGLVHTNATRTNLSLLGTASGGTTSRSIKTKLLPWCDETAKRHKEFRTEMRLLSRLRHPCITTVMGAVMTGSDPMMVMEFMENGSLYDLLRNETLYTGGEIITQIVRDIAQGLRFLHASKPPILHRDLKAKNILIDSRFRAKVADFGLATNKPGLHGTPFWMAPEYLTGKKEYNSSCDIYSFGMIIYEIYSRKIPYEGQHPRKVLRKVCDPRINYRPTVPDTCPKRMAEIMTKCWSRNDGFRPQAKDLDMLFSDMNANDAEPLIDKQNTRLRTQVASGDMLYQVFPKKVADQLKAGQKVEPETHDNVTVFFSDIVRFTDISRALSPVKVCNMLDRLYVAFDALANKHGVFKVETIGDAWVGVTNLEHDENATHVKQIAEFAVEAVAAASNVLIDEDDPSSGYLHIRVGFHSGPVVSNVIGSLNPRYALFGDTMNTAARMEGLSTSDRIQCSNASARLLKEQAPDFPLRRRGKVAVKGKGQMTTYWVGTSSSRDFKRSGSMNKGFDEKPMVEFEADDDEEERGKFRRFRKRKPKRLNMAGAIEEDPSNSAPMSFPKSIMKGKDKDRDLNILYSEMNSSMSQ